MTPLPDPELTSPKNPRVRAAAALRDRRERDEAGLTLVDGARELAPGARRRRRRSSRCSSPRRSLDDAGREAVDDARRRGRRRPPGRRPASSTGSRSATGPRASSPSSGSRTSPSTRCACPATPSSSSSRASRSPGNLGAVLRTADGAGADAVIAADPRTDLFNPNAIRASLGTIFAVPVAAGAERGGPGLARRGAA